MNKSKVFNNAILERLSRTNSFAAISVYLVVSACMAWYGFANLGKSTSSSILFIVLGLVVFTLVEYVVHRFLYHSGEDYKDEVNWQYKVHGVHHIFPKDKDLLAMPIPLALFLSVILILFFYLIMGSNVFFFYPGFLSGYAIYLYIHYIVHAYKPPKNAFRFLWRHHLIHHYSDEDRAFGVTSPFWDYIFGTMPVKKSAQEKF